MRILFVASEIAPWSKTGGLADVSGALPRALAARGHHLTVVSPLYRGVDRRALVDTGRSVRVEFGSGVQVGTFHAAQPAERLTVLLVENPAFYDRPGLYGAPEDYPDNHLRFAFLSRAALLAWSAEPPDILHLNDWQTALAALYARIDPRLARRVKSVFTIHNLAYQGLFERSALADLGLPWDLFRPDTLEFHGRLCLLKAGLIYADLLTTVSPRYAQEIQTAEFGAGLDGVLRARGEDLMGILNGAESATWDPGTDRLLAAHFTAAALSGKAICKAALQRTLHLPERPEAPILACVGRMTVQKGHDLLAACADTLLRESGAQLVLLGSGDRGYEALFHDLAARHPRAVAVRTTFDETLAHQIQAGADILVMPSRFEPCGLSQLYALRYGTVPVVRAVGGLDDTVRDGETGFKFREATPEALLAALRRALALFADRERWTAIQRRAMAEDFSWEASAAAYEAVYRRLTAAPSAPR